jgi:sirohydrochlorin cobaltochelatase
MKTVVVLAMHGSPPRDFPGEEMQEFFGLQAREHQHPPAGGHSPRFMELEARMRAFPRNEANDPFWKGSRELAAALERACGLSVLVGYNEFCAPSLEEAFDQAAASGAQKIIVVTPMMTRGGEHAENEIRSSINRAQERHPAIRIIYAWPFPIEDVATFLAKKLNDMPELG